MVKISRKFSMVFGLILLLIIPVILYTFSRTVPAPQTPEVLPAQDQTTYYTVTNVVDGDTIDVTQNGQTYRVRLIGIDTPEIVDPRKPIQCFAKEASDKAKQVLLNQEVKLEVDPSQLDKDKYGRLLRYVFLKDGTFFNKYMIEEGYAHEYTYDTPYEYQQEFKAAEVLAQANNRGLWNKSTCPK